MYISYYSTQWENQPLLTHNLGNKLHDTIDNNYKHMEFVRVVDQRDC